MVIYDEDGARVDICIILVFGPGGDFLSSPVYLLWSDFAFMSETLKW